MTPWKRANMDVLVALEGKQALTIAKRIRRGHYFGFDAIMPQHGWF